MNPRYFNLMFDQVRKVAWAGHINDVFWRLGVKHIVIYITV